MSRLASFLNFTAIFGVAGGLCLLQTPLARAKTTTPAKILAKTVAAQKIAETNRFLPLKKITVGPEDQYHGSVDPSGRKIVYSQKADLIAHVQIQDIKTGEVQDLLPLTADSQEPIFSPDGRIAFTYYKFSARGDICYTAPIETGSPMTATLNPQQIHCLKGDGRTSAIRANPFWLSATEIGYVTRDINSQSAKIVAEDIENGHTRILADGKVLTPSMRPGGRYLVYNQVFDDKSSTRRSLVLKDLKTEKTIELRIALPGISGFPAVSDDEQFLYFSHYLNDSNEDNIIDGADNGVVFRIPIQKILAAGRNSEIFPEQLTSVESSCSLPRPFQSSVFVTCAFEGSLDIYEMPATGIIPASWNETTLRNALQTSRSYQDRILVLNTLKYRAAALSTDEHLLSNFILADDTAAARYYLDQVESRASETDRSFYQLLRIYLQARELKKSQPSEEVSPVFQKQILSLEKEAQKISGEKRFHLILRGFLKDFASETREASSLLSEVHFPSRKEDSAHAKPIELYLYFELAHQIWGERHAVDAVEDFRKFQSVYHEMMSAPELSEQAQVYYAFTLLNDVSRRVEPISERIKLIESLNHDLPSAPKDLLAIEAGTLRLIQAPDDKKKLELYQSVQKIMARDRSDYFLRRAFYVRSILNYSGAAEFKYMGFVVNAWLDDTLKTDTEFIFAREVFADSSFDQAYAYSAKGNLLYAENFFYQAVLLTDDLEAHNGYIETMMRENKRKGIDVNYTYLQTHGYVVDSLKYAQAMLLLIDGEAEMKKDPTAVQTLGKAIEKLESMEQDRESSVRYLLLGYCYMEKLLRLASGYDLDANLFQNARRNLMLAYDQGRDNTRVKASALMNLAILNQRAQNHGLAVKFFSLRKPLGFENDPDGRNRFSYLYAKSLFEGHLPDRAATELAELPQESLSAPILEHEAFYFMNAGKFKRAAEIYSRLFTERQIEGDLNLAKVNLSYGYTLFKLHRADEAENILHQAMEHANRLGTIAKEGDRLIDFHPIRVQLVGYGLLSQLGSTQEKIAALEKRALLLEKAKEYIDSWFPSVIQNRLQLAALYSTTDLPHAVRKMDDAIKFTEEYGDASQYLGNVIFQSAVDYLAHGILHPELYEKELQKGIHKVVEECLRTYDQQKDPTPFLTYQKIKLKILWAGYQNKIHRQSSSPAQLAALVSTAQSIKSALPVEFAELESLSTAVLR
jgi:hypothetical protein